MYFVSGRIQYLKNERRCIMRILLMLIAGLMLNCTNAAAKEKASHWEELQKIRQYHENTVNSNRGPSSADIKYAPKVPEKQVNQPKKPTITQPEKPKPQPPHQEVKKPEKPQPEKIADRHNPHGDYHQPPQKDKPQPPHGNKPHKKHHHYQPPVRETTYVYATAPSVSYVTSGNGVIYQANPHIYSANAYNCYMKKELKYCTDNRGRALTGRIVQNYTDSVAYERYKNGYLNGETSVYDLNGTLLQTTNYSKGLKHGKETVYFDNGRVHYSVHYSRGNISGSVVQYDYNGVLVGEMQYSNGRYTTRYCRVDAANDLLRARIRANTRNELILCTE